jgi:hypothetical protein
LSNGFFHVWFIDAIVEVWDNEKKSTLHYLEVRKGGMPQLKRSVSSIATAPMMLIKLLEVLVSDTLQFVVSLKARESKF